MFLPIALVFRSIAGILIELHGDRLRMASVDDISHLAGIVALLTDPVVVVNVWALAHPVPLSAICVGGPLGFAAMVGGQWVGRFSLDQRSREGEEQRCVLVAVDAGGAGGQIATWKLRDPSSTYRAVALLDDGPRRSSRPIHGVNAVRMSGNRAQDLDSPWDVNPIEHLHAFCAGS